MGKHATRMTQPGYIYSLVKRQAGYAITHRIDAFDYFVFQNDPQQWFGQFAVEHMQIGARDAALNATPTRFIRQGIPHVFRPA